MEQDISTTAKRGGIRRIRGFIMTPVNSYELGLFKNHGKVLSSAFGRFLLEVNLSRGLMKSKSSQSVENLHFS
jgi:hypothetical protein